MLFLACATLAARSTRRPPRAQILRIRRKNSCRRRWPPDERRFLPESVPPGSRVRGPKLSKASRPRTERTFMPRSLTRRSESPDPSSVCRVIFAFDCRGRILRVFPAMYRPQTCPRNPEKHKFLLTLPRVNDLLSHSATCRRHQGVNVHLCLARKSCILVRRDLSS
jgi:hypothetical protein